METDTDSLLDRIRAVEEKIENGLVTTVVQQADGTAPVKTQNQPKPEVPKAIPEDVKQVVQKWPGIVGNAGMPLKLYLKNARLSLGGDNKLMMVVEDGVHYDYLRQEGCKEQVESLIEDYIGKHVEINLQPMETGRVFENSYIDLSKIINIEIEEED